MRERNDTHVCISTAPTVRTVMVNYPSGENQHERVSGTSIACNYDAHADNTHEATTHSQGYRMWNTEGIKRDKYVIYIYILYIYIYESLVSNGSMVVAMAAAVVLKSKHASH